MKIYIESMGCDSNRADTNRVSKYLEINNIELINNFEEADFIILMSCGFNKIMLNDNLNRLKEFSKTNAKLILGGCVSKIYPESKKLVDFHFSPREIDKLNDYFKLNIPTNDITPEFNRNNKKIIRISTGCQGKCSYCAIKFANGITKSRSIEEIKKDIVLGVKEGIKEFFFTAEDVGSWGTDIEKNLKDLIDEVVKLQGDFKISLTTINPKWFIEFPDLKDIFNYDKINKRLYLSIQSGSDKILKLMQREYTLNQYIDIFNSLKNQFKDIKIQVDLLVGFPTESEEDFQKTLALVKNLDIHFLQVFAYTDMKGTLSNNIFPKVPLDESIKRARNLIATFLDKNKAIINRKLVNTNIKDLKDLELEINMADTKKETAIF